MLKANAQRLRWYLGLRQILDWPKYFIAPIKNIGFRRARATEPFGETTSCDWPASSRSVGLAGPLHLASEIRGAAKRLPSSFSGMVLPATRYLWRDGASASLILSPRPNGSIGWPRLKPPLQAVAGFNPGRYFKFENNLLPDLSSGPLRGSFEALQLAGNIKSLGPVQGASRRSGELGGKSDRFAGLATPPVSGPIGTLRAARHHHQSLIETGAQVNSGAFLPNETAMAAGAAARPNEQAVSTIHIDGSALGRWAVQYLERALGKPATGMTGIDPRASRPRYRVSPF
jgi:hypothetical protein